MNDDLPTLEPGKRYGLHPRDASTAALEIVYDTDARTLEVEYPSGQRYEYLHVPPEEFLGMFRTDSVGGYINSRIKRHEFRKL